MKSQITTALYHKCLSVLSKLCERIALNQLMPYLEENDRFPVHQSGNKKWYFTETSLIYTSDRILTSIDHKKTSAVVLLDMSKAFDSVNHDILVNKLQDIGLSSSAIEWFRSYLFNRYHAVRINTAVSEPRLLRCGFAQGNILGPRFFIGYANDLPSIPQHCSTARTVTLMTLKCSCHSGSRTVNRLWLR